MSKALGVTQSLFELADIMDALPTEKARVKYGKEHLAPLNFELHPYILPENGYHIYGMQDGLVVCRIDGTMMIMTPKMLNE